MAVTRTVGLILALACGTAAAAPTVELLSSVDGAKLTSGWKYLRRGQSVRLSATASQPAKDWRWLRIDPLDTAVDNTQPRFHFEELRYAETELTACRGKSECPGELALQLLEHSPVPGTGTVALRVEATFADGTVASTPGVEARVLGGLGPAVHRLVVRRDDSYLGHLTELFNTPYIFGSSGDGRRTQPELLIGSDCADLAVYGLRRGGREVPFVSTWTIEKHVPRTILAERQRDDGVALGADDRPIAFGDRGAREGDLLLFPSTRHVGVLYEDRPPLGVLDTNDLMLHTCWARPTVEPLAATGCASFPIRVLRP